MTRLLNLLDEADSQGADSEEADQMEERQPYDKLLQAAEYGFQCFLVITSNNNIPKLSVKGCSLKVR